MLERILHIILDLILAFLLIVVCADDVGSYIAGLSTVIVWIQIDKLFKE